MPAGELGRDVDRSPPPLVRKTLAFGIGARAASASQTAVRRAVAEVRERVVRLDLRHLGRDRVAISVRPCREIGVPEGRGAVEYDCRPRRKPRASPRSMMNSLRETGAISAKGCQNAMAPQPSTARTAAPTSRTASRAIAFVCQRQKPMEPSRLAVQALRHAGRGSSAAA